MIFIGKNEFGFNSFFSVKEWDFIQDISNRFPERTPSIITRFQILTECAKEKRAMFALQMLKHEPRRGFIQRGYTPQDVSSIYGHTRSMARLLGQLKKDDTRIKDIFPGTHAQKILVHDLGEAATTDFTPLDIEKISPEEKTYLEDLAIQLILEHHPERYKKYIDYKKKVGIDDHMIKIIDVLELIEDAKQLNVTPQILDEFQVSARKTFDKYAEIYQMLTSRHPHVP